MSRRGSHKSGEGDGTDPFSDVFVLTKDEIDAEEDANDSNESDDEYDETMFTKFLQGSHSSGGSRSYEDDDGDNFGNLIKVAISGVPTFQHTSARNASLAVATKNVPAALRKAQQLSTTAGPLSAKLAIPNNTATSISRANTGNRVPPGLNTSNQLQLQATPIGKPISEASFSNLKPISRVPSVNQPIQPRSESAISATGGPDVLLSPTQSRYISPSQFPSGVRGTYGTSREHLEPTPQQVGTSAYSIMFGMDSSATLEQSMTSLEMALRGQRMESLNMLSVGIAGGYDDEDDLLLPVEGEENSSWSGEGFAAYIKHGSVLKRGGGTRKKSMMVNFQQKKIFLQLCFIFGVCLLVIVVYDYICLLVLEFAPVTVQWLISLLFLHVSAMYLFLLSFIYANESRNDSQIRLSYVAGGINAVAFILRVILQLQFSGYEPAGMEDL
ncbi:hypothetical protein HDU79_001179 [Rhizoclosmatium sp. JEL0117]|nr:hypothetical protein HDU79_001179 [Rhizoclosmatium sp. JEL0117]